MALTSAPVCCSRGTSSGASFRLLRSLSELIIRFCSFTGGYIEVSVQLPGASNVGVRSPFSAVRCSL